MPLIAVVEPSQSVVNHSIKAKEKSESLVNSRFSDILSHAGGGIPAGGSAAFQAGFGADASPERLLPMASPSSSAFESHDSNA